MFSWAVDLLAGARCDPVVVAVPPGMEEQFRAAGSTDVTIVPGGSSRRESVRNALERIETPFVIVHDAARPLAAPALVEAVVAALGSADAAVPVVPVTETLKRVDGARVGTTIDRTGIVYVQTPQAFRTDVLRQAHAGAAADGFDATDDAQLIERYGGTVAVVPGDRWNVKVTFPEDLMMVERLLADRVRQP